MITENILKKCNAIIGRSMAQYGLFLRFMLFKTEGYTPRFSFFNLIDNLGYDQLNTMIQSFIFFRLLCDKIEIPLLLE